MAFVEQPVVTVSYGYGDELTRMGGRQEFTRIEDPHVRFQTMSGPIDVWVDGDGWLHIKSSHVLVITPDGETQIKVRA